MTPASARRATDELRLLSALSSLSPQPAQTKIYVRSHESNANTIYKELSMIKVLREFIRIVKSSFTPGSSADTPRADRAREQRDNQARLDDNRKIGE